VNNTKPKILILLLAFWIPENAYAYLDPASGNAIASFVIALFGSAVFFLKSIFYKIFSRSRPAVTNDGGSSANINQSMLVIFSEGKTYWTTFSPIVEELINQKIHFRYLTLDVHDPGLEIDNAFMHSQRFPKNRLGFVKLANIAAPVMLSTTPNIGSEGYPMARPVQVVNLVHVFHAMVDVSCYRKGSLDFYDTVLMAGAHEKRPIRLIEEARNLEKKALVVAGLPCLDELYRQKQEFSLLDEEAKEISEKIVLIAPSWGAKGCFSEYGIDFVKILAAANYHVIIRLHPHSYLFEPDKVEKWFAQTSDLDNVFWDNNAFGTQVMAKADILISDASSIRFDFAFLYQRPVITLPISRQSRNVFESDYMQETWADNMSEKIGVVAGADKLHIIDQVVEETINNFTKKNLKELREACVANFGNSASVIVAYLNEQVELLNMTAGEQSLKQQVDLLRDEVLDLRQRLSQSETAIKKFSE